MRAARSTVQVAPAAALALAVSLAVALGGCTTAGDRAAGEAGAARASLPDGAPEPDRTGSAPDVDPGVLPARPVAPEPAMRLAAGLSPPTNRWFSGLVFGDAPQPVFPLPLAVGLTETGFAYGLPDVRAEGRAVLGPFVPQVAVTVGEAVTGVVVRYDVASVTVALSTGAEGAGGRERGELTLVEGSPALHYRATTAQEAGLGVAFAAGPGGRAQAEVDGRTHLLVGSGFAVAERLGADGRSVRLEEGEQVAWLPLPDPPAGSDAVPEAAVTTLADAASRPVTGTSWAYGVGEETVTTGVTYDAEGGPTAVVRLPHQRQGAGLTCDLGTYRTVLGTADACTGTTHTWAAPAVEPAARPDVAALGAQQRAELADQVRADAERLTGLTRPADTYFGGKALARDANLLTLAEDLGLDDVAGPLRDSLAADLRRWADPEGCATGPERCFVWDPHLRTVVGLAPSFGSEEGNDHHFHYGYFLYAAAVVADGDAALADDLAPVVDLLAADIAAGGPVEVRGGAPLPALRVLDVVAGHSWASGYAPFADGNNQESTSEAVAAWNGLALWAAVRDDDDLEAQARWMLALEAAAATTYGTAFDRSDPVADGLDASVTSLVWGGKRERNTWFSAEPSAALGILVLPVGPVSGYLAGGPDGGPGRIADNLAEALGVGPDELWADPAAWDVMFGDQLLAYAALAGPREAAAALDVARELPDERIDDGSTRSWLLALLMTRAG